MFRYARDYFGGPAAQQLLPAGALLLPGPVPRVIAANFFGRTRDYPAFGKYDPLQKIYHALLTLLAAAVIFSGVYLVVNAEVWATFSHAWMRSMRVVHDVGAFAFLAILVGHIY